MVETSLPCIFALRTALVHGFVNNAYTNTLSPLNTDSNTCGAYIKIVKKR
jgi:hypothetical protein